MPRQMNLDSFAVLATRVLESLPEGHEEAPGVERMLKELAKLGITTVPKEIGLLYANTESSKVAAEAIQKSRGDLCQQLAAYLATCGAEGATDAEMQEATGMYYKTQMPRRIELQAAGLVVQSGEKRMNPDRPHPKTPGKIITGLPAMVWVSTEHYDPLGYHSQEAIDKRAVSPEKKKRAEEVHATLESQMMASKVRAILEARGVKL